MDQRVRISKFANIPGPNVVENVFIEPCPEPGELSEEEILVRMRHGALHPADFIVSCGLVDGPRGVPTTIGVEGMGVVVRAGSGVASEFPTGTRVHVLAWQSWGAWAAGVGVHSATWSQTLVTTKEHLIPVPHAVSATNAAQFFVNPVAAYVMVMKELALKPGDWLVHDAAGSAIGKWITALCHHVGIHTICLIRRESARGELEAWGQSYGITADVGHHVLVCHSDGSNSAEIQAQVRSLTGGGAHAALDCISGSVMTGLLVRSLRVHGRVLVYGILDPAGTHLSIGDIALLATEGISIKGFSVQGRWVKDTPDDEKRIIYDAVWELLGRGGAFDIPIDAHYPLAEAKAAMTRALSRRHGKVLLDM